MEQQTQTQYTELIATLSMSIKDRLENAILASNEMVDDIVKTFGKHQTTITMMRYFSLKQKYETLVAAINLSRDLINSHDKNTSKQITIENMVIELHQILFGINNNKSENIQMHDEYIWHNLPEITLDSTEYILNLLENFY